jgi:hypothetical protein
MFVPAVGGRAEVETNNETTPAVWVRGVVGEAIPVGAGPIADG